MKILILASNPRKDLNLDQEIRDLKDVIERSNKRQQFEVEDALAVRVGDLQDLLLRHKPQIVHFCGHGGGKPGLVFEGKNGGEQWVQTDALRDLFKLLSNWVGCVLLNACYSEEQANEIVKHIDYVIGMNQEIRDDAAIAFSKGFYRALGYECTIEQAYEFGCNAIQLEITGSSIVRSAAKDSTRKAEVVNAVNTAIIPEHLKPTLKKKQGILNFEQWKLNAETPLLQKEKEAIQWELAQEITGASSVKGTSIGAQLTTDHLLPSQNPQTASTSDQRTRKLTGVLLTCLLIAGGATGGYYGYRYWQKVWDTNGARSQLHEIKSQGLYKKAEAEITEIEANQLKKAIELYDGGDIDGAIALAQKISRSSSSYQPAQEAIATWEASKKQPPEPPEPKQPPEPPKPQPPEPLTPKEPDYQYLWLSEKIITPNELEGKSDFELDVMQNSLFARHGLIFDRPELQSVFEKQPWYKPLTRNKQAVYNEVTFIEWRNYEIIKQVRGKRQ